MVEILECALSRCNYLTHRDSLYSYLCVVMMPFSEQIQIPTYSLIEIGIYFYMHIIYSGAAHAYYFEIKKKKSSLLVNTFVLKEDLNKTDTGTMPQHIS